MIKRVRIVNFKSLTDVTVDLGPVTVLIGRSGTGKSNFVEAIRWLRDVLRARNVDPVNQRYGGWDRVLSLTSPRPMSLSMEVTFAAPRIEEDLHYRLSFQQPQPDHHPQFHEEKLSLGDRALFHHTRKEWVSPPEVSSVPRPDSLLLGSVMGLREDNVAYQVLTKGIGCYSFSDSVLARPQGEGAGGDGLQDNGRNFLEIITAIHDSLDSWHHLRSMTASLKTLKNTVSSIDLRVPERNRVEVTHHLNNRKLQIDLAQESEGFRRLLACLLALYQEPPKKTAIFDEPEKGIYPIGLATLAEEFKGYASQGRGQVLFTTHSPEFLNYFRPEDVRVVEMHDSQTRIGLLSPEQFESLKEGYLFMKELLTVDEAHLSELPVEAP